MVRDSAKKGSVTFNDTVYKYEVQSFGNNEVVIIVNDQIRRQEYFVDKHTVHIFNHNGDQLGFKFMSDERKVGEDEGLCDQGHGIG